MTLEGLTFLTKSMADRERAERSSEPYGFRRRYPKTRKYFIIIALNYLLQEHGLSQFSFMRNRHKIISFGRSKSDGGPTYYSSPFTTTSRFAFSESDGFPQFTPSAALQLALRKNRTNSLPPMCLLRLALMPRQRDCPVQSAAQARRTPPACCICKIMSGQWILAKNLESLFRSLGDS